MESRAHGETETMGKKESEAMSVATAAKLERRVFETSRELEFFSEKELVMQIGYNKAVWPLALMKELIDNALDACEVACITPEIEVTISNDSFAVRDNGPGLPESTMAKSMNYLIRVSDKAYYVSPTRGFRRSGMTLDDYFYKRWSVVE